MNKICEIESEEAYLLIKYETGIKRLYLISDTVHDCAFYLHFSGNMILDLLAVVLLIHENAPNGSPRGCFSDSSKHRTSRKCAFTHKSYYGITVVFTVQEIYSPSPIDYEIANTTLCSMNLYHYEKWFT